jgi:hypothetical protein
MGDWRLRELRGEGRRTFLRMCGVVAAAVGIERSKLLTFLADQGGNGLAEAAGASYRRALIMPCPNGSFGWMQELWPMPDLAVQTVSGNLGTSPNSVLSSYLFCDAYGYDGTGSIAAAQGAGANYRGLYVGPKGAAQNAQGQSILYTKVDPSTVGQLKYSAGGDRPMFYGPDAPLVDHAAGKPIYPVSCFMSGTDETHTSYPMSATVLSSTATMPAALAALGATGSSALVPAIGIAPFKIGRAPGVPGVATVANSQGLVDLFNSAAGQFTLATEADRKIFHDHYQALVALRRSSGRSTWAPQLQITGQAAELLGIDFAPQLTPTQSELNDFGVTELLLNYGPSYSGATFMSASQQNHIEAFLRAVCIIAKAFALGLVKTAILPLSDGPSSDTTFTSPHQAFVSDDMRRAARNTVHFIGRGLNAFYKSLAQHQDPESPFDTLDKSTLFVTYGDTGRDPLSGVTSSWSDATPNACNWLYLIDPKGYVKNGWFGQCYPSNNKQFGKNAVGFSPITGLDDPTKTSQACSQFASTAAVYACARGDKYKTSEFGCTVDAIPGLIKKA